MVAFIACVTDSEQSILADLPLNREHVVLGIRYAVAMVEIRVGADRGDGGEVEACEWITRGDIMRREVQRKRIRVLTTSGRVDEGRSEQRRLRPQIVVSIGRHAVHDSCR